ncbi:hypothetical protein FB451DRAFT_1185763 [Mycena latifolia]|nr:hypothetical protein FB451DRAFT_1185763 [Mycena latifolia]
MQTPSDTDAKLLLNHELKTDIRLAEIHAILYAIDDLIASAKVRALKLKRTLKTENARERHATARNWELEDIRREIRDAERLLRIAAQERAALEDMRDALLREGAALRCPITAEAFRAAPMRRMPADILRAIFVLLTPDEIQPLGWGVVPSASMRGVESGGFNLLKLYLQRAKGAPLTVMLNSTTSRRGRTLTYAARRSRSARVMATVAAHSDQLYSLRLLGNDWSSVALHGFRGRLLCLEVLQLPSLVIPGNREFELAPRLHTLILNDSYSYGHPDIAHPDTQIRSLHLRHGAGPAGLGEFANLTSLTCTLRGTARPDVWRGAGHIVLPCVARWRLNFAGKSAAPPGFFTHYTAPALASLEIAGLESAEPTQLGAFVKRSHCALTCLILRRSCVPEAELMQVYKRSPTLVQLVVREGPPTAVTERLLEAMTARADHSALLPELKSLVIEGTYMYRDAIWADMVGSRSGLNAVRLASPNRIVQDADVPPSKVVEDNEIMSEKLYRMI